MVEEKEIKRLVYGSGYARSKDYVKDAKGRNGQNGKDYHVGFDVLDFDDA